MKIKQPISYGLKERDKMRQSLELAKEVQQNFLPRVDPKIAGLDIAGQSIYCERTGGDYYDYLEIRGKTKVRVNPGANYCLWY